MVPTVMYLTMLRLLYYFSITSLLLLYYFGLSDVTFSCPFCLRDHEIAPVGFWKNLQNCDILWLKGQLSSSFFDKNKLLEPNWLYNCYKLPRQLRRKHFRRSIYSICWNWQVWQTFCYLECNHAALTQCRYNILLYSGWELKIDQLCLLLVLSFAAKPTPRTISNKRRVAVCDTLAIW